MTTGPKICRSARLVFDPGQKISRSASLLFDPRGTHKQVHKPAFAPREKLAGPGACLLTPRAARTPRGQRHTGPHTAPGKGIPSGDLATEAGYVERGSIEPVFEHWFRGPRFHKTTLQAQTLQNSSVKTGFMENAGGFYGKARPRPKSAASTAHRVRAHARACTRG